MPNKQQLIINIDESARKLCNIMESIENDHITISPDAYSWRYVEKRGLSVIWEAIDAVHSIDINSSIPVITTAISFARGKIKSAKQTLHHYCELFRIDIGCLQELLGALEELEQSLIALEKHIDKCLKKAEQYLEKADSENVPEYHER